MNTKITVPVKITFTLIFIISAIFYLANIQGSQQPQKEIILKTEESKAIPTQKVEITHSSRYQQTKTNRKTT